MRFFLFFLLSPFCWLPSMAFQDAKVPIHKAIDGCAADFLQKSIAKSVSIAIHQKGKSYTSHHGELDPLMQNRPTNNTIYEIASVTKTFTGLLAAKAVLDGKLALDADIRVYLENSYPNLEKQGEPVRVRHLITHTSGFPADQPLVAQVTGDASSGAGWQQRFVCEKLYSKEKFFEDLKVMRLHSIPGKRFLYSNVGTNMVAHLLERVYGVSYETLLKQMIFDKANMRHTRLNSLGTDRYHLANGYNQEGLLMPHLALGYTLWGAEGALKSTAPDMLQYMCFLLHSDEAMVKEAQKRLFKLDEGYWVGYFWWIINLKNRINHPSGIKTLRHDGGAIGTRNVLRIYPENDLGIWVITNVTGSDIFDQLTELSYDLFDALSKY